MVAHQPKKGHPPKGYILQTQNLALKLNSHNLDLLTTARDSPANPRMVTHQPKDGHPPEGGTLALRLNSQN